MIHFQIAQMQMCAFLVFFLNGFDPPLVSDSVVAADSVEKMREMVVFRINGEHCGKLIF